MSVKYLNPSNPGAATQAERDAAATANWNAIKAATGQVNTTASPVRVGRSGGNQGVIRLKPGIWWLQPNCQVTAALGFNNRVLQFAPGATVLPSDGTAGFFFTMTGNVTNCSIIGLPWTADAANGEAAAPSTMTNKTGAGWPTIAANLGGGAVGGPSVTANGDPRVPWTYPVSEMMSVGVDKNKWAWANNHLGFINAQNCTSCEMDRQFYFGYVDATSSGAAMLVPRATAAAGGGVNGSGAASPHDFYQGNQFMINAPQGFGLNQWTDARGFEVYNLYCCGGEAMRMETHKPNDGGIHDGVGARIAQAGGNVGCAFTAHNAKNGIVRLTWIWSHSPQAGAVKVRDGVTGGVGYFSAGSYCRHVTAIGSDKTWAQDQSATAGNEGNTPATPDSALQLTADPTWLKNVAFTGDIAFGHMDNMGSTTGGVPVGTVPNKPEGFNRDNASYGIKATTRDLTGPHPTDEPPVVNTDLDQAGSITPHGAQTFVGTTPPPIRDLTGRAGTVTPASSHLFTKIDVSLAAPILERTPSDPSTDQAAFFRARMLVGANYAWRWQIDNEPVVFGAPSAEQDYRTFPVTPGEHTVQVYAQRPDGAQTIPAVYEWLVPSIQIPAPAPDDLLGCGLYTVYVKARGGGPVLFALPFTSLSWERPESQTGQASIQIDGISNYGDDCCRHLGEIQPWKHEIAIYRDNRQMFWGPITSREITGEQAKLTCRDVSAWAGRRRVGKTITHVQKDLAVIARDYWLNGLSRDKTPNVKLSTFPVGILADRTVEANKVMVDDQIGELVRTGLSWAAVGRTVVLGVRQSQTTPVARLMDAAFVAPPGTVEDGSAQTNDLVVLGEGAGEDAEQPSGAARDQASVETFGLLEDVISESDIKDDASATANARTQVALLADPPATISGGTLSQTAPVTIDELLAGLPIDIRLTDTCVQVAGVYRMVKIAGSVAASGEEQISLDVELISVGLAGG